MGPRLMARSAWSTRSLAARWRSFNTKSPELARWRERRMRSGDMHWVAQRIAQAGYTLRDGVHAPPVIRALAAFAAVGVISYGACGAWAASRNDRLSRASWSPFGLPWLGATLDLVAAGEDEDMDNARRGIVALARATRWLPQSVHDSAQQTYLAVWDWCARVAIGTYTGMWDLRRTSVRPCRSSP